MSRKCLLLFFMSLVHVLGLAQLAVAADADQNGIQDQDEQELIEKFCPSLVMDSRDLANGETQLVPEPVELFTNRLYGQGYSYPVGMNYLGNTRIFPTDSDVSDEDLSWIDDPNWQHYYFQDVDFSCSDPDQSWIGFHYDFGGFGPGCTDVESDGWRDQPIGWGSIYEDGLKGTDGSWITRPGSYFPNTVYAHIFQASQNQFVIQYWFFYAYNDWVADHEGDWEHIDVHFSGSTPAMATMQKVVYYFHHRFKICETLQTENPNGDFDCYVMDDTHPVVFVGGWAYKNTGESEGVGPGSHGCYPVHGSWDDVVHKSILGLGSYEVDEHINGLGAYLPWAQFIDDDPDDADGVVLLKNPSAYNFATEPHKSWIAANLRWGHPIVKGYGTDQFEPFASSDGAESPFGPFFQETWENSGNDVGVFRNYPYDPNEFAFASDADWEPPYPLAISSPVQDGSVFGSVAVVGSVSYSNVSVEIGVGANPATWSGDNVVVSTPPVYSAEIAKWNTGLVAPGTYTIRVRSTSGGQTFERKKTVSLHHRVATVGVDFSAIQTAINWAQPGDTVRVQATQQYYESLSIGDYVSLVGMGGSYGVEIWGDAGEPAIVVGEDVSHCLIDGFIFRHNYQPGWPGPWSGTEVGAKIDNGQPVFRNCLFTGNSANYGGAVQITANARPIFEDCQFSGNRAGVEGGAISIANTAVSTSVECHRCVFEENIVDASNAGAAVSLKTSSHGPTPSIFSDCEFIDNGIHNEGEYDNSTVYLRRGGAVQFINCTFATNRTKNIVELDTCEPIFDLCTVVDNGGIDGFLSWASTPGAATIRRSIVAYNDGPLAVGQSSLTTIVDVEDAILYSNADQGRGPSDAVWAAAGQNSFSIAPAFCDLGNGDYELFAYSPASAPSAPYQGYFGERVGAHDVGCVPPAVVTVTALPTPRFQSKPWIVVACPKGDLDTLSVTVNFNGPITRTIDRLEVVLDADGLDAGAFDSAAVFDQSGYLEAQGDAVGPDYVATIKHPYFGGHGNDSVDILLNGHPLASQAHFELRSIDITGDGVGNLVDLGTWNQHYQSPPKPYSRYCDFSANEYEIILSDFAVFGAHYGHAKITGHQQLNSEPIGSNAGVDLQFTEEFPTANTHRLYVDVSVENFGGVSASAFSMQSGSTRLSFVNWIPAGGPLGDVLFSPVIRDGAEELFFGVLISDNFAGTGATLGRLVFDVSGAAPMEITEDNFVLTIGDVLLDSPEGNMVLATMEGVFARTLDPAVARVFHDRLEQNFPNPFNPTTTLAYSLKSASKVTLTIFDVAGRRVRELVNDRQERGAYRVVWDGRNDQGMSVSSGVYFYKLVAGSFTDTKKMTILK